MGNIPNGPLPEVSNSAHVSVAKLNSQTELKNPNLGLNPPMRIKLSKSETLYNVKVCPANGGGSIAVWKKKVITNKYIITFKLNYVFIN